MDPARPTSRSRNLASPVNTETAMIVDQSRAAAWSRAGYFRWVICALLLFGTTKNYMDRNVLGVLNKTLQHDLGWSEIGFSNLVIAFQAAYAVGMLLTGRLIDKLGTRLGYSLAMVFWSLASMGTALGNSLTSFAISRAALGFGEAAVFPASIKAVAEWFPKKERALATGIFNAGTSFGAMLAPVVVPWLNARWGWRGAFVGFIASRSSTPAFRKQSLTTSAAILRTRWSEPNGLLCFPCGKLGRSSLGNF
jgi:ACS family hexuronate transporter-like MFS transporter